MLFRCLLRRLYDYFSARRNDDGAAATAHDDDVNVNVTVPLNVSALLGI